MAMSVTRRQLQAAAVDRLTSVVAIADGAIEVDGYRLDVRGASAGASVARYFGDYESVSRAKGVALNRNSDGVYSATVTDFHTSADASAVATVSSYPATLAGAPTFSGQPVEVLGSITRTDRFRQEYRDLVAAVKALGLEMNDIDAWHPHAAVGRRHDWLYWAFRVSAYLIAHGGSYTYDERIAWAAEVRNQIASKTPLKWYEDMESASAPTSAVSIVDPSDNSVKDITQAVAISGVTPSTAQLKAGAWVEDLEA